MNRSSILYRGRVVDELTVNPLKTERVNIYLVSQ